MIVGHVLSSRNAKNPALRLEAGLSDGIGWGNAPDGFGRPAVGGLFGCGGRVRLFFLGLELRVVFVFAKEIRQSLGLANLSR